MKIKTLTAMMVVLVLPLLWMSSLQAGGKAEQTREEMKRRGTEMYKIGIPGAAHEILKPLEGNWTVESRGWDWSGKAGKKSSATASIAWILNGRYLKEEFKDGEDFESYRLLGYNNLKEEYFSVWAQNSETGLLQTAGRYDPATKTIKTSATCRDRQDIISSREEWKIVDKDRFIYSFYLKNEETGKEDKHLEMTYNRVK